MTSKSLSVATALSVLALASSPVPAAPPASETRARLLFWNQAAIDASGLDHTRPGPEDDWTWGQQLGPGRASRAAAIVHIAMFEAVNAIAGDFESYAGVPVAKPNTSMDAAIAFAAHDTLVAMFPSQRARLDALLAQDFARIPARGRMLSEGVGLGHRAAAVVLAMRAGDGSEIPEPLVNTEWPTSDAPGHWRQEGNIRELRPRSFETLSQAEDENGQSRIYLGIHWAFDKTAGIAQGRQIADWVFEHAFKEQPGRPSNN